MGETSENSLVHTYRTEFEENFEDLDEEVRKIVAEEMEVLMENYTGSPWNHPDVDRIDDWYWDHPVWRLDVEDEEYGVDHRVGFDIDDESGAFEFLLVDHRDNIDYAS